MTRGMAILHQWDAAGRDIRSNGLAEGHNGAELSVHPDFTLCRPGLSSKLPLRGDNPYPQIQSIHDCGHTV